MSRAVVVQLVKKILWCLRLTMLFISCLSNTSGSFVHKIINLSLTLIKRWNLRVARMHGHRGTGALKNKVSIKTAWREINTISEIYFPVRRNIICVLRSVVVGRLRPLHCLLKLYQLMLDLCHACLRCPQFRRTSYNLRIRIRVENENENFRLPGTVFEILPKFWCKWKWKRLPKIQKQK